MVSRAIDGRGAPRRGLVVTALLALSGALLCFGLLAGNADAKKPKAPKLNVMTRNIYLGADLGPILNASGVDQAVDAGGEIANQVDRTNFPLRSKALAAEILSKRPDLVGLQEVALWRTAPTNFNVVSQGPSATTVEYDFLQLLLAELNKSGNNYEAVVIKEEFDAEFPVNDDGNGSGLAGADHNERLTMRDVILRRVNSKAKVSNPNSGTFSTLLRVNVAGALTLDVTRGWTAVDAKLKGTKQFRFVNTHLEAFDSQGQNPANNGQSYGKGDIRAAQAQELVAAGGPADPAPKGTVILVGDVNSDDDTVQPNGDRNAYLALLAAGLSERSTNNPLSCCLNDPNLVNGSQADFDHQVDHVLTDTKKVKLVSSSVVGLAPVSGLWPSDHAGVDSILKMPKKKK